MASINVQIKIGGRFGKVIYRLNRSLDKKYDIGYAHISILDSKPKELPGLVKAIRILQDSVGQFEIVVSGVGAWDKQWIYLNSSS